SPGVFSSTGLDLSGLPFGYLTLEAYVTVGATTYSTTRRIIHDLPPTVAVTAPGAQEPVQGGTLHVAATCSDDDPAGCASLVVQIVDGALVTQVAAGTTSVNATVPVSTYDGRTVTVRFIATDSRGNATQAARQVLVDTNPHVVVLAGVPGRLLDADDTRLLYLDSAGALVMRTRASGADEVVVGASRFPQEAYLSPSGAIFIAAVTDWFAVFDWQPGAAPVQANPSPAKSDQSLVVKGGWAIWVRGQTLMRRDLTARTNTVISTKTGDFGFDVAANGDVVYSEGGTYAVHRYRGGVDEVVGPASAGLYKSFAVTDGNLVVYSSVLPGPSDMYRIYVYEPTTGETTLSSDAPYRGETSGRYQVAGGWTAYVARDGTGEEQIWRRSPSGVIEQVNPPGTDPYLIGLGTDGSVLYGSGTRRYLARPGSSAIDVGYWAGERAIWLNGRFLVLRGGYLLQINP
ncbi:MAG TPA: hypothetical protein VFH27_04410, partial [Longimicrobiaceae bacterium]|nr:hypothetical protein [Longimicrobiaceae bacterium]